MKMYFALILIITLSSFTVMAHENENRESNRQMMMGEMMKHRGHLNMEPRMQEMMLVMKQIGSENNQQSRDLLMQKHMKLMRENMQLINDTSQYSDDIEDMSSAQISERMQMMEERTKVMQLMMEQMLHHSNYSNVRAQTTDNPK